MNKANKVDGKDLMLWIGGKVIALSKSCSLSISANMGDAATKDSGIWDDSEVVGLSFTMQNQSVYSADENRTVDQTYDALFDAMLARQPIDVTFGIPSTVSDEGLPAEGWQRRQSGKSYAGKAFITSLELSGEKGSAASASISLQGSGRLRRAGSGSGN